MLNDDGVVMGSEADLASHSHQTKFQNAGQPASLLMIYHGLVKLWVAVKHIHKQDAARSPHVTPFQ